MRYLIIVLALAGIVVSTITLRIHYSADLPLANSKSHWNSSAVNHNSYSNVAGVPVSVLGIIEYALLGLLAYFRRRAAHSGSVNVWTRICNLPHRHSGAHSKFVVCLLPLLASFMVLITLLAFGQLIFNRGS